MATPALTLARLLCRLEVQPKAILYHARRETFAANYYPAPYADWELGAAALRLTDNKGRKRMVVGSDGLGFESDDTSTVSSLHRHILGSLQDYLKNVVTGSHPKRFGWRLQFVTEHSSFDALYPLLRSATIDPVALWKVEGYAVRDVAHTLYYGTEDDGLNLALGVLTPEQGREFLTKPNYRTATELAIRDGALIIDLDRYIKVFTRKDQFERLLDEQGPLTRIAQDLAARVLNTKRG